MARRAVHPRPPCHTILSQMNSEEPHTDYGDLGHIALLQLHIPNRLYPRVARRSNQFLDRLWSLRRCRSDTFIVIATTPKALSGILHPWKQHKAIVIVAGRLSGIILMMIVMLLSPLLLFLLLRWWQGRVCSEERVKNVRYIFQGEHDRRLVMVVVVELLLMAAVLLLRVAGGFTGGATGGRVLYLRSSIIFTHCCCCRFHGCVSNRSLRVHAVVGDHASHVSGRSRCSCWRTRLFGGHVDVGHFQKYQSRGNAVVLVIASWQERLYSNNNNCEVRMIGWWRGQQQARWWRGHDVIMVVGREMDGWPYNYCGAGYWRVARVSYCKVYVITIIFIYLLYHGEGRGEEGRLVDYYAAWIGSLTFQHLFAWCMKVLPVTLRMYLINDCWVIKERPLLNIYNTTGEKFRIILVALRL